MKTTNLKIAVLLLLLTGIRCGDKKAGNENETKKNKSMAVTTCTIQCQETPNNLYPLSCAIIDIQRYYDFCVSHGIANPLTAFTYNSEDVFDVMGFTGDFNLKHMRGYIGLDSDDKYKLFLVPVLGADLVHNPHNPGTDQIIDSIIPGCANTQWVYELNFPCPDLCDASSVLAPHN